MLLVLLFFLMTSILVGKFSHFSSFSCSIVNLYVYRTFVFIFRNDSENIALASRERRQRKHNFNYIGSEYIKAVKS